MIEIEITDEVRRQLRVKGGKYSGWTIGQLPNYYIRWMVLDSPREWDNLSDLFEAELLYRRKRKIQIGNCQPIRNESHPVLSAAEVLARVKQASKPKEKPELQSKKLRDMLNGLTADDE